VCLGLHVAQVEGEGMPGAQVTGGTYAPLDSGGGGYRGGGMPGATAGLGGRGWRVCLAAALPERGENRGELCISGI
jgi:hypothetical protein